MSDRPMIHKPTPEQVAAEIAKLRAMKPSVRHHSGFGEDNHEAIDADIEVLEKNLSEDEIYHRNDVVEDDEEGHFTDYALDSALDALRWRDGDEASSPSSNWEGLVAV